LLWKIHGNGKLLARKKEKGVRRNAILKVYLRCMSIIAVAPVAHVGQHFRAETIESTAPRNCTLNAGSQSQDGKSEFQKHLCREYYFCAIFFKLLIREFGMKVKVLTTAVCC